MSILVKYYDVLQIRVGESKETVFLNYVRVPRRRTAPDRANKASASARRPTLGPPANDVDQDDVTSPPTS